MEGFQGNTNACNGGYGIWECHGGLIHLSLKEMTFHFTGEEFHRLSDLCTGAWSELRRDCPSASLPKCSGRLRLTNCCHQCGRLRLTLGNVTVTLTYLEFSLPDRFFLLPVKGQNPLDRCTLGCIRVDTEALLQGL